MMKFNRHYDRFRVPSSQRGYDAAWRRARKAQLEREPRCQFHLEKGILIPATVVDHIISIRERPDLRLEPTNLRSSCEDCHNKRTMMEQSWHKGHRRIERSGCDPDGRPIDPNHPWNK